MSGPGRLVVEACAAPVLVEDLGRPGLAHLGVSGSGAADRAALRLANRLVGNPEGAAGLEILLGSAVLRSTWAATVAVAGAEALLRVDGSAVGRGAPLDLRPGSRLHIGAVTAGLRVVVSVRGGVATPAVLGSRARDTLSGLGPEPLVAGDAVPVGPPPSAVPTVDLAPLPRQPRELVLTVRRGPRDDWFTSEANRFLSEVSWTVTARSDRVGVRLAGPALERSAVAATRELASEGMVRGAIQVPPDGMPVVLGPDRPTTGGYPVIAVIVDRDLDAVVQAAPGTSVRFRTTG